MPSTARADGFKTVNGFLWPADDEACHPAAFAQVADIETFCRYVTDFETCVQAGGNCGVFPCEYAKRFKRVITFEMDPDNFSCLAYNTRRHRNVIRFNAALGNRKWCGEAYKRYNVGGHYIIDGDAFQVMRVDDLELPSCGLIQLDVEGSELDALKGAAETIRAFSPVVVIEDKGHEKRYGYQDGDTRRHLMDLGYREVESVHKDRIWCR